MHGSVEAAGQPGWLTSRPRPLVGLGGVALRRWSRGDLERLHEAVISSQPELRPWMPWADGFDRASGQAFLDGAVGSWGEGREFMYAIEEPDGTIVGSCGLHARRGEGVLEIGYWVRTSHTGRGIASLVAAALTAEAVAFPEVTTVQIHHDRANERSGRIPRRLGFELVDEVEREPDALGEEGIERVWRLPASAFAASPAAQLLEVLRGSGPPGSRTRTTSVRAP
jgi:ribosomal-protein-serine acetyltransferase